MIVRTLFNTDTDDSITIEFEDGDEEPEPGDVISISGVGYRLGKVLYDKFGVRTYKVVERNLADPYQDE